MVAKIIQSIPSLSQHIATNEALACEKITLFFHFFGLSSLLFKHNLNVHTSLCIVDDLKGPLKIERPLLITLFSSSSNVYIHEICCYLALEKPRGNQFFGTTLLWLMMGRPKQRYLTYMYVCLFFATEFQYKQVGISKDIYYYSVDFDRSCSETLVYFKRQQCSHFTN